MRSCAIGVILISKHAQYFRLFGDLIGFQNKFARKVLELKKQTPFPNLEPNQTSQVLFALQVNGVQRPRAFGAPPRRGPSESTRATPAGGINKY